MLDRRTRPIAARLLGPLANGPVARLSPIFITAVGLGVGLFAALSAGLGWWDVALVGWLVNRLIDGIDGLIARATGRSSDLGGYLDMCADVLVYAAVPLGVAVGANQNGVWVASAFLVASFYVNIVGWSYLSALLEKQSLGAASRGEVTSVTMPPGLIEGTETIIWLTVILALPDRATWTMGSMAVAVGVSAILHVANGVCILSAATDA